MVSAGYMAKRVASLPTWLPRISTIYSVSGCVSNHFAEYINFWKHNGYTLLFFYEVFEQQYDAGRWAPFAPEPTFDTAVKPPPKKQQEGFDVVTFSSQTSPECSPLSCNALGAEPTNSHCLLESFEDARRLVENGTFDDGEPGPHRIFAVYTVAWHDAGSPAMSL
jgi:hypothetical protein